MGGSASFILKRVIVPFYLSWWLVGSIVVSIVSIEVMMSLIEDKLDFIFSGIIFLFCALCTVHFWRKFPSDRIDAFYIRSLLLIAAIWFLVHICLVVALVVAVVLKGWDNAEDHTVSLSVEITIEFLVCFLLHIMVIYPQDMVERDHLSISIRQEKARKSLMNPKSWEQIAQSDDGYVEFANFLEKEFSTENILFLTEYVQLKTAMMQYESLRKVLTAKELNYTLKLPLSAPNSLISKEFNMDKVNAVYSSTRKLYAKYIDPRAYLQININSTTRAKLGRIFDEIGDVSLGINHSNANESACEMIMPWMEEAATEISRLMLDSYYRFRRTPIFFTLMEQEYASVTPRTPTS